MTVSVKPPRFIVRGHRVHHGLVGLLLILHDLHDWRVWLSDLVRRSN